MTPVQRTREQTGNVSLPLTASGPFQSAEDVHLLAILLRVVGSNLFAAFDPILQVILEVLRVERLGQRSRRRRIKIAMTAWSLQLPAVLGQLHKLPELKFKNTGWEKESGDCDYLSHQLAI